jgi:hypothetical protein
MTDSDFKALNVANVDMTKLLDNMRLRFMYLWLP